MKLIKFPKDKITSVNPSEMEEALTRKLIETEIERDAAGAELRLWKALAHGLFFYFLYDMLFR